MVPPHIPNGIRGVHHLEVTETIAEIQDLEAQELAAIEIRTQKYVLEASQHEIRSRGGIFELVGA